MKKRTGKTTHKNTVKPRNEMAWILCTSPLFSNRSIPDKKKKLNKTKCRGRIKHDR